MNYYPWNPDRGRLIPLPCGHGSVKRVLTPSLFKHWCRRCKAGHVLELRLSPTGRTLMPIWDEDVEVPA